VQLRLELGVPLPERELRGGRLVRVGPDERGHGRGVPDDQRDGQQPGDDGRGRDARAHGHPAHRGRPPGLAGGGGGRCVRHRAVPPGRTGPRRCRRGWPRGG
jgi:hypothetical protein